MNVLILGGSGFVGTRLTELLIKDHQVTIGDLVKSDFYPELWKHCDICVDDDLRVRVARKIRIIILARAGDHAHLARAEIAKHGVDGQRCG